MDIGKFIIDKDTVIEDEKVILTYEDCLLMSSNNLSVINGEKGSMKSTLKDLLIEQLINPTGSFKSSLDGGVAIIDTEQGKRIIKNNLSRFSDEDRVRFYTVKGMSNQEMIELTESVIIKTKPEVLVIDSSRDFILNSNDPSESMKMINLLLYWAYEFKCHIVNIVHSVKSDYGVKTRGTYGGELDFKAESVLNVSRKGDRARVTSIHNRESLGFKPFTITLNAKNKPEILCT